MPVTVGTLAATTEIYAIGMMCEPDAIHERWTQAQLNPDRAGNGAIGAGARDDLARR